MQISQKVLLGIEKDLSLIPSEGQPWFRGRSQAVADQSDQQGMRAPAKYQIQQVPRSCVTGQFMHSFRAQASSANWK